MSVSARQANRDRLMEQLFAVQTSESETARLLVAAAHTARGTALYDQLDLEARRSHITVQVIGSFLSRLIPETRNAT